MTIAVDGVVLAAGLSSRAGRFKMELNLGDKTLIEHSIAGMYAVVDRVIVVGGHKIERIREILQEYSKVEIVYNEHYRQGMFSSVQEGLRHVSGECFFLQPGDLPLISEEIYRRMLEASGDVIIPTYKGRKGHPALMRSRLIDAILHQPDTSTLRDYIGRVGYAQVEVDDEGIVLDVDDLEDYHIMKRVYENEY